MADTVKKGARITGADRSKLAGELTKKYTSGASIRALAEETGRSYGFIHRILTENDETNAGMLAINERLGYRPLYDQTKWVLEPLR